GRAGGLAGAPEFLHERPRRSLLVPHAFVGFDTGLLRCRDASEQPYQMELTDLGRAVGIVADAVAGALLTEWRGRGEFVFTCSHRMLDNLSPESFFLLAALFDPAQRGLHLIVGTDVVRRHCWNELAALNHATAQTRGFRPAHESRFGEFVVKMQRHESL